MTFESIFMEGFSKVFSPLGLAQSYFFSLCQRFLWLFRPGVAKLRLASRMPFFEPLYAAL